MYRDRQVDSRCGRSKQHLARDIKPERRAKPALPSVWRASASSAITSKISIAGGRGNRAPIVSFNEKSFEKLWQGPGRECACIGRSRLQIWRSPELAARIGEQPPLPSGRTSIYAVPGRPKGIWREEAAEAAEDCSWIILAEHDCGETEDEERGGEKRDGAHATKAISTLNRRRRSGLRRKISGISANRPIFRSSSPKPACTRSALSQQRPHCRALLAGGH